MFEVDDLSRSGVAILALGYVVSMAVALLTNVPCLFFDWDGAAWALAISNHSEFSNSLAIAQVNPLQGMFDLNYHAYRGGIPQWFFNPAQSFALSKFTMFLWYCVLLSAAIFFLGRTVGFSRLISAGAALAYSLLVMPVFTDSALISAAIVLCPIFAILIACSLLAVALFWAIGSGSWLPDWLRGLLILGLLAACACSVIFHFIDMAQFVAILGLAALFSSRNPSALRAKLIVACVVGVAMLGMGFVDYILALGSNIAYSVFGELRPRALPESARPLSVVVEDFASQLHAILAAGKWWLIAGVIGAIHVIRTTRERSLRAFSWGFIALVAWFLSATVVTGEYWGLLTGQTHYTGPVFYWLTAYVHAVAGLFAVSLVGACFSLFARALLLLSALTGGNRSTGGSAEAPQRPTDGGQWSRPAMVGLYAVLLAVTVILAAAWNPGFGEKRCTRPYFYPLERNKTIDYLESHVSLKTEKTYRGSVATFTGAYRQKNRAIWFDNIATDFHLWYHNGNDLRTIGLWQYHVPTLTQMSVSMTPGYFLTIAELLTNPGELQARNFIGMTHPHDRMMALWGVRYVISDQPLGIGEQRLEMPVKLSEPPLYGSPIRLYELANPNLGNYTPTEVVVAGDAKTTLERMRKPGFDGEHTVITDAELKGRFVPARAASMTVEKGALRLKASSAGESLLVLPVQYSHCWAAKNKRRKEMTFFRANMMQLGVRFSGELDAHIEHRFGPFWNSSCRRLDASDAEQLKMSQARSVEGAR